ncbi:DNA methyltransferase, partial [Hydrogenibacillus schlegelii]
MFPLDFPLSHLKEARREDWVLDPFCGRGTTLYAARLLGLP